MSEKLEFLISSTDFILGMTMEFFVANVKDGFYI